MFLARLRRQLPLLALTVLFPLIPGMTAAQTAMTLDASAPRVKRGDIITYTLRVPVQSTSGTLSLTLPSRTVFLSASDGGVVSGGVVAWTNVPGGPGTVRTYTATVRVGEDAFDDEVLRAIAYYGAYTADRTITVEPRTGSNTYDGVSLYTQDDPDPVQPGETITYRLSVENGDPARRDIELRATLDPLTSYLSASEEPATRSRESLMWSLRLDPYASRTMTVTVRLLPEARDSDTVRLKLEAGRIRWTEGTRVEQVMDRRRRRALIPPPQKPVLIHRVITPPPSPPDQSLALSLTADRTEVQPGEEVVLTVMARNTSNAAVDGLVATLRIDADDTQVMEAGGARVLKNSISWPALSLQPGQAVSHSVRIRVHGITGSPSIGARAEATAPGLTRAVREVLQLPVIGELPKAGVGNFTAALEDTARFIRHGSGAAPFLALFFTGALSVPATGLLALRRRK
ncbi:MAG: hypothetical protein Greene041619_821 [Candidatus Peregrinibacteria bacterium Greene0416_19]|nr:MAG: hypothetical protein Greene041619_821 [Candidatus Peregrinibacteria bacterium Greene0416_19]